MTTFSFHPVKTITSGEGGAITTNDKNLYQKLKQLVNHGIVRGGKESEKFPGSWYYEMHELGYNYRLSDLHAALGISQFKKIDRFVEKRREIAAFYDESFKQCSWLTTPFKDDHSYSSYHLYPIQIEFDQIGLTRTQVIEKLREKNVMTQVHYIPIHLQPYYASNFGFSKGDFPTAEKYYQHTLSIPLFPGMRESDIETVASAVTALAN